MALHPEAISGLAATKPPCRGIAHGNSYLRFAMPQLHAELVKLGCEIEWSGLTNIVSDNAIYAGWQQIYRVAHGHGFAPETAPAATSVPAAASGQAQVAAFLESLPKPAAPVATKTTEPSVITFAQWRSMSAADQLKFCRDGGEMFRDAFLAMPSKSQSAFLSGGGKIFVPTVAETPKTQNPPANSMWRRDFLSLTAAEQTAHLKRGGKIHA